MMGKIKQNIEDSLFSRNSEMLRNHVITVTPYWLQLQNKEGAWHCLYVSESDNRVK